MEQQKEGGNFNSAFSEFNTQLRDIDERNRLIRERVLLLGKNLITIKSNLEEELEKIKRENSKILEELEKMKRTSKNINFEIEKFVKREEMAVIERMLKDFQPLEFLRKSDVEEMIKKQINTVKTSK